MKAIWAAIPNIKQSGAVLMPAIVWDFLKMFTAAVAYGVLISLIAAGIALLLAATEEAGTQQTMVGADIQIAPLLDLLDTASRR